MKKFKILFILLISVLNTLFAQKNDSIKNLEGVSITAKRKFIPQLKTLEYIVLDQEEILKHQGNTLMASLEKIPGINSINTGSGISKPVIRGLSLNRIIVNEFGIKQEGQQWGLDHGLEIDQYNVNQLEIIKGPVSILYGSDGIGGVINILKPKDLPKNSFQAEAITNYKSNNDLFGTSFSIRNNKNNIITDFRVTYQSFADYRVPADEFTYNTYILPLYNNRLKNTAGNDFNLAGLVGIKKKWGKTSLYISNVHQNAGFFIGAFGTPKAYLLTDDGDNRSIDLPKQIINHFKIISNTQIKTKNGLIDIDLAYQNNNRQELSLPHAHGQGLVPTDNLALQLKLQTLTANARVPIYNSKKWNIVSGINLQHQDNVRGGYEFLIPDFKTSSGAINGFAEYSPSNRWMISSGIRLDFATQAAQKTFVSIYDNDGNEISTKQRSPDIDKTYSNISASFGSHFEVNENSNIKLDLGSAFRVPTLAELTSNGIHHGTFRHEMGDSSLQTERGYMINTNYNYNSRKVVFSISPFFNYFTNYIYLRPSSKFSFLPDAGQIYLYSEGESIFFGSEISTKWTITKQLSSETGIEYVYNENISTGIPLPFTPPLSLREEIEFTPAIKSNKTEKTYLSLIGHYYASQQRVDINEATTEGYFLMHFTAGSTFIIGKNKIGISLQVRNLTNTKYLNNMSRYRILNLPEQGINVNATLKYHLN